jgi:hypothetical protein
MSSRGKLCSGDIKDGCPVLHCSRSVACREIELLTSGQASSALIYLDDIDHRHRSSPSWRWKGLGRGRSHISISGPSFQTG